MKIIKKCRVCEDECLEEDTMFCPYHRLKWYEYLKMGEFDVPNRFYDKDTNKIMANYIKIMMESEDIEMNKVDENGKKESK